MDDARRSRHQPERTCIGCRTPQEARDLLRFVCTPQGLVTLDRSGHAPGRGIYSCCNVGCVRRVLHAGKLAATFQRVVVVPDFETVYQGILVLLDGRLRTCLSLGQKAGALVSGYVSLQKAFVQARLCYVILAEDIAPERAVAYRAQCLQQQVPCATRFTKEEMGHILGKSASRSAVGFTAPHFLALLRASLSSLEKLQTTDQKA